jgi:hypothetical protein
VALMTITSSIALLIILRNKRSTIKTTTN